MFKIKNLKLKILIVLLIVGGFLRFYNLNWGAPFYFHPDERNIASLITSLDGSNLGFLLKGTFAYGTLVSNIVFVIKNLTDPILRILGLNDPFGQSIILLRIVSSVSSIFTILIVFLIGHKTLKWQQTLAATLFTTFSVGLIQAAHFGVYESILTLMYSLLLLSGIMYLKTKKLIYIFMSILIVSLATAIKINSFIFLIIPVLLFVMHLSEKKINKIQGSIYLFLLISSPLLLTFFASPYYLTRNFRDMFAYEASLLTGSLPVFYTGEFFGTIPVIYQFTDILPFLINPILTLLFIIALPYVMYRGIKKRNVAYLMPCIFFVILFLPNALLFAKWTRYLVPTLPFIYLIISIGVVDFLDTILRNFRTQATVIVAALVLTNAVSAFSYLSEVFIKEDTRIAASKWASWNIPKDTKILSEVYDLGITPFNPYLPNITLFNFYDLDGSARKKIELEKQLKNADYLITPSQRVLKSRIANKEKFPNGFNFYSNLLSEKLGFKKIYETPCDIFCKITYLGNPVFNFEETTSVFDRPTVYIFKRVRGDAERQDPDHKL